MDYDWDRFGKLDWTKSRTEADSVVTPSDGMRIVYVSTASSSMISMMASISLPVGGVVGVLGDGDHPNALTPQHRLEGHGVLPFVGEAGESP